ncbi:MAG: helicase [Chloroflexi bacterium]|nr:helicase [Chloroflexota bacterium]
MLVDHPWRLKYTSDDGDLVQLFYLAALEDAERYDRLTGYFTASALALAARGIEGLVRNGGRMRLIVGCTLDPPEIEAIEQGEQLRCLVERHLTKLPLAPPDTGSTDALELLAWMVGRGILEVKVAVPCDTNAKPIPAAGIFHEKTGIIEDRGGDKIAWTGSLNETGAGWRHNWESISVYTSWGPEPGRVDKEAANFARIWAGKARRVIVLDVPSAVREDLMRFMPKTDLPARLAGGHETGKEPSSSGKPDRGADQSAALRSESLRNRVWSFIAQAPSRPHGGARVGEVTASVTPWPHQFRALERLYQDWPPRLLIADEVGLGKTIQAGLLLRQAWLAGRAKRILILAPKAVLGQWQIELREKFNLNWPIYDGGKLTWYPSPALRERYESKIEREEWFCEPAVIASSQLMRRTDRAAALLETADPWDLVVLDEAHHARRRGAGSQREGGPNALLRLMQGLQERSRGLVLMTATPMQVHPVEVWDLLNLLGLPPEWTAQAFLDFFDDIDQPSPSAEALDRMASLFRSAERAYGEVEVADAQRLTDLSRLKTNKVLRALRDAASIPRRQLETAERRSAIRIMRASTPVRRLVSRNTRELLRRYYRAGMLSTPIADRQVEDRFLEMTAEERAIYVAVENYIAAAYSRASGRERTAVGFVMTVYRRRIASSFVALRETLRNRRNAIASDGAAQLLSLDEDVPDDEAADEFVDADEAARLEREALANEQRAEIDNLLAATSQLPPDSKLGSLRDVLRELRQDGYRQAMVFTQYTDTMDFLRGELLNDAEWKLLCFSGRGGEVPGVEGTWRRIGRDDAKRRFRDGDAEILLCTDAAAEGLNFQFCGALVNYDMPWNPMRVEQRIGRIDRLGQRNEIIRVVNLHYEGTVETDVYRALRERIGLFESVVGRLQPILAHLPRTISQTVLSGEGRDARERANVVDAIERETRERQSAGFDIDTVTETDLSMPERPPSIVTMDDLDRIIGSSDLMPPGVEIQPMGHREYGLLAPDMTERLRVTTDPEYFEEHAESVELWSPGNPLFVPPESTTDAVSETPSKTLKDILDNR